MRTKIITQKEASRRLGVSRQRVHQLVESGELPVVLVPCNERMISLRDLAEYQKRKARNGKKEAEAE